MAMPLTTIKVSTQVRDRLKRQAHASSRTLGEHLEHLADLSDRQDRFAELKAAIEATPADAMSTYRAETEAWELLDR